MQSIYSPYGQVSHHLPSRHSGRASLEIFLIHSEDLSQVPRKTFSALTLGHSNDLPLHHLTSTVTFLSAQWHRTERSEQTPWAPVRC